jgi:hypothetical protein
MPEVYDIRGVLAPEDFAQDCGPWLVWVEPSGLHSAAHGGWQEGRAELWPLDAGRCQVGGSAAEYAG